MTSSTPSAVLAVEDIQQAEFREHCWEVLGGHKEVALGQGLCLAPAGRDGDEADPRPLCGPRGVALRPGLKAR